MKPVALLCLIVASLVAVDTHAVTRYVRSPIGNDQGGANDCTNIADPCLTLTHAETRLVAGDTLWVAGAFTESVIFDTPVTIVGRTTALFPTAFPPCSGDDCPTITAPDFSVALLTDADISIQWVNFEDSMDDAVFRFSGELAVANSRFVGNGTGIRIRGVAAAGMQITDSSFSDNGDPNNLGGAIYVLAGSVTVERTTFQNNAALRGGAIYSLSADATIIDVSFSQNTAVEDGGAIYLESGTVSILDSTFSQNTAVDSGGAIHVEDGTLLVDNSPMTMNVSTSQGGAVSIVGGTGHRIENTLFDANRVEAVGPDPRGGALFVRSVLLDNVSVTNNAVVAANASDTAEGGGIWARVLTVVGSEISDNEILNSNNPRGDGVFAFGSFNSLTQSGVADNGAVGIWVFGGMFEVFESTISGHSLAGLRVEGTTVPPVALGRLTVRASTISGNSDGITMMLSSDAELVNTTLSGNARNLYIPTFGGTASAMLINSTLVATAGNSALWSNSDDSVTLTDTIVEGACVSVAPTLNGQNVYDDANCGPSPVAAVGIGPLADNGGPTLTHALTDDSPAVDAGGLRCQLDPVNFVDQRGVARPFGSACDVGAFELTAADSDGIFADGFEIP